MALVGVPIVFWFAPAKVTPQRYTFRFHYLQRRVDRRTIKRCLVKQLAWPMSQSDLASEDLPPAPLIPGAPPDFLANQANPGMEVLPLYYWSVNNIWKMKVKYYSRGTR
ncbi:uncharacterized protein EI90DRAFT_3039134 [Cantharellus anzutake]|uniref:uncharacterized protein n=1 Tax=Cantharellus anzutake TaxID=1750568 RepID=UPI00190316DF|nr:uncharacterized protein EI90DRAFT_3039134 [Cantharellus anzutake]KAF8338780.1 hypothetical protein EI90DRAFT_3039134 [Cantharellus anzutake]